MNGIKTDDDQLCVSARIRNLLLAGNDPKAIAKELNVKVTRVYTQRWKVNKARKDAVAKTIESMMPKPRRPRKRRKLVKANVPPKVDVSWKQVRELSRKELVRIATEAGILYRSGIEEFATVDTNGVSVKMMQRFATLIATAERDVLVKLCDGIEQLIAAAIRTCRGEK